MKIIILSLVLFCFWTSHVAAQNDYIVTTPSSQEIGMSEEEQFIAANFPLQPLCKWTPGMKFIFISSSRDMFLPTLSNYETEKGLDNSILKHKILTFTGTEEIARKISDDTNYNTRFIFECEGEKYYYEIKNMRLDDANNYSGYRDVAVPINTEATITAVGVGSPACPVKMVLRDTQGKS